MLRELKLGVWLDPTDVARLASEDGVVLDVEDADVIRLTSAPSALEEGADVARERWEDDDA